MISASPADIQASPPSGRAVAPGGAALIYVAIVLLVGSAWQISRMGWFSAGDDISYWLAVCGGSMMALLFVYPLRKYVKALHRVGRVKYWFVLHMVLGVMGPWLILVHSTFRIGSLNAGVALFSMIIVVISGVIGRFIYVRVHRGLDGERTSLKELQQRAGLVESEARSRLSFAPEVERLLHDFEARVLGDVPGWRTHVRRIFWLPLHQWRTYRYCVIELRGPLQTLAVRGAWTEDERARRERQAHRLVSRYLSALVRVAQFSAYERMFALWHVAHLPFVFLLVFSAVVHVVAVHAY